MRPITALLTLLVLLTGGGLLTDKSRAAEETPGWTERLPPDTLTISKAEPTEVAAALQRLVEPRDIGDADTLASAFAIASLHSPWQTALNGPLPPLNLRREPVTFEHLDGQRPLISALYLTEQARPTIDQVEAAGVMPIFEHTQRFPVGTRVFLPSDTPAELLGELKAYCREHSDDDRPLCTQKVTAEQTSRHLILDLTNQAERGADVTWRESAGLPTAPDALSAGTPAARRLVDSGSSNILYIENADLPKLLAAAAIADTPILPGSRYELTRHAFMMSSPADREVHDTALVIEAVGSADLRFDLVQTYTEHGRRLAAVPSPDLEVEASPMARPFFRQEWAIDLPALLKEVNPARWARTLADELPIAPLARAGQASYSSEDALNELQPTALIGAALTAPASTLASVRAFSANLDSNNGPVQTIVKRVSEAVIGGRLVIDLDLKPEGWSISPAPTADVAVATRPGAGLGEMLQKYLGEGFESTDPGDDASHRILSYRYRLDGASESPPESLGGLEGFVNLDRLRAKAETIRLTSRGRLRGDLDDMVEMASFFPTISWQVRTSPSARIVRLRLGSTSVQKPTAPTYSGTTPDISSRPSCADNAFWRSARAYQRLTVTIPELELCSDLERCQLGDPPDWFESDPDRIQRERRYDRGWFRQRELTSADLRHVDWVIDGLKHDQKMCAEAGTRWKKRVATALDFWEDTRQQERLPRFGE